MTLTRLAAPLVMVTVLGGCIEQRAEVATITLDYLTTAQAAALAEPYLSREGKLFISDAALNTITVRDRRDNIRRVQSVLNQRDASPDNVSLHFQVVRATEAGAMDPALARVGTALRELLRFEGYELVSQAVVSASERRVMEQTLSGGSFPLQLGVRINDVAGSGSVDMQVDLRRDGQPTLLTTNVVVPMGQTVVLGSAYPGAAGEALILTVRGERGSTKLRSTSRRSHDAVHEATAARAEAAAAAVAAAAAAEAAGVSADMAAEHARHGGAGGAVEILHRDTRAKTTVTGAKTRSVSKTEVVPRPVPSAARARTKSGEVPPAGSRRDQ